MIDPLTKLLLEDMLANARRARAFLGDADAAALEADEKSLYSVVHAIALIGEAASKIDASSRATVVSLPFRQAIDMRNRLIHGYRYVQASIVFETVRDDLPPLIAELELILGEGTQS